ncbi:chymotrypsin-related [Holotrichia oblita]|nr:chymotrypsin-related [Holotrichia oblita]
MQLLLIIAHLFVSSICATSLSKISTDWRIIGGQDADIKNFKYQVYLSSKNGDFCGGSIIDRRWILTAGHCVNLKLKPEDYHIVAGTNTFDKIPSGTKYYISDIIRHKDYTNSGENENFSLINDIALLKLQKPIKLGPKVGVIKLDSETIPNGKPAVISGWGCQDPNNLTVTFGMKLKQLHISTAHCEKKCFNQDPTANICRIRRDNIGVCYGDSGSPLVNIKNGKQAGIASFVSPPCGNKAFDVFVKVATSLSKTSKDWRVINGQDADINNFKFQVYLTWNHEQICGGSIINESWILTAGHCFPNIPNSELRPDNYSIVTGTAFNNNITGNRHNISKIIRHENWSYSGETKDCSNFYVENDVALLKLAEPIEIRHQDTQVVLLDKNVIECGTKSIIAGWGLQTQMGSTYPYSPALQQLEVFTGSCNDNPCVQKNTSHMKICAVRESKKGVCVGDSGGPLINMKNGKQIGIASFVIKPCATNNSDVFVRISSYIEWIESTSLSKTSKDWRVINGQDADINNFKFQVYLTWNHEQICGGSIINESWILTAGHCFPNIPNWQLRPDNYNIVAGTAFKDGSGKWIGLLPGFYLENDVTLLKLAEPIERGPDTEVVLLDENVIECGTKSIVAGWGRQTQMGRRNPYNPALQQLEVFTGSCHDNECVPKSTSHMKICAVRESKKGLCFGDSGGPLINMKNGKQIGIVSSVNGPCATDESDVFVRISSYIKWIESTSLSKTDSDWRIFNGAFAAEDKFKYLISLRKAVENTHKCGGSIIHENWILTAAHCVFEQPEPHLYFVVADTKYLDYTGDRYNVSEIIMHPDFILTPHPNFKCQNDVALLKLSDRINGFGEKVELMKLEKEKIGLKQDSVISGWGATTLHLISAFKLKYASVETISCQEFIYPHDTTDCNICIHPNPTGRNPGSAWRGDSGGPLVIEGSTNRQIGIASFTDPTYFKHVDVYVRISCYYDWINETIKQN